MYQNRGSTTIGKYVLFLLGICNLVLGLYFMITRDRAALIITKTDIGTNTQLFTYLLCFLGTVLVINGLYNLLISLKFPKLIFFAALLEFIKGAVVLYLEYINKISNASLPRLYLTIGVMFLALIAIIAAIKSKFTKKYIFFDN